MKTRLLLLFLFVGVAVGQEPARTFHHCEPWPGERALAICFDDKPSPPPCSGLDSPKPEPMDVPAVKLTLSHKDPGRPPTNGTCRLMDPDNRHPEEPWCEWAIWTCADKTRVLLTDEAGGKHCIKFSGVRP